MVQQSSTKGENKHPGDSEGRTPGLTCGPVEERAALVLAGAADVGKHGGDVLQAKFKLAARRQAWDVRNSTLRNTANPLRKARDARRDQSPHASTRDTA